MVASTHLRRFSASFGCPSYICPSYLNILCTCPPSLKVLSCVHASHINALRNIQCYPHMLYKTFTKPSQIHIHIFHCTLKAASTSYYNYECFPAQSTLTLNIQYYSYMPCRLVTGSSGTFGPSSFCFLSTPDTLVHISEYFYCARKHTGMHSGIYPLPSIWPLCLHLLKSSITFRSIIKHSYYWPPHSKLIGTYMSLIYSSFISFYFFLLSCFSHFSSHFMFQIFTFLFLPFIFLFLNFFEYLYTHVLVVSQ